MSAHVEVTPNVIRRPLARFLVEFSLVFGLLLLGGLFLAVRIASVLVRPIRELIRGVEIVSAGDFDYRLPLRSADEIGVLTRGFNRMTAGIREAQALRIQQERIRNELEFAAEIQTKLIPSQPLDYPQYHIEHVYSPAKEIGGDYYDFFPLDSGRLGFVLCDVSGKGVPAAMVMSMLKTIFLALSGRGAGPAETLSVANVLLRRNIRQNVFAAAFYGELDTVNHSLTFAMAGAEKMFQVIATDGSVREWKTPGMPLGLMDDAIFRSEIREERITIGFDDRFLFYTDGLTDVRDAQSGFFGEEGIRKFLSEHVTDPEFCRQLVETTVRFRGSDRQEDDLSFIYLARKSAGV
jgi:sigma-B regulation protein RsbU (phosphoserine phosphatase)